jgi:1,2-diacylglycerol 3-alpha-glucosyltransferase
VGNERVDPGTIARALATPNMPKVAILQDIPSAGCGTEGGGLSSPKRHSMRLGFFTEVYRPVVNGVVASVEALAEGLGERGHQVYCFTPRMPGYEDGRTRPNGAGVYRMPSLPLPARTPYRLTLPLVSRRNVNTVIKRLSLIHVHSPFVTGWMGLRYARRYGMPLIYTYHTQLEAYAHYVPFEPNATRFAASQLTRAFANAADAVIVPTVAMAEHLRDLGVSVRIEVVPSGIDVRHFGSGRRDEALRSSLRAGPGDRLLLCVSRLAKEKNVELLLEALARRPDPSLKLAIAGDGPAREELEAFARARGLAGRVTFMGVVDRERLPDLYASADAFVMPSTSETQGLVLAEALAAGAPNRNVLGEAGSVVPADPAAFAGACAAVPAVPDPVTAARSRRRAERFSVASQVDRMLEIYESLLPLSGLDHTHLTSNIRSV